MSPPAGDIYDHLAFLLEIAKENAGAGHPVEALIALGNLRSAVTAYLDGMAH